MKTMPTKKAQHVALVLLLLLLGNKFCLGQHVHEKPSLHINTQWKQCSFQLDSSLTQEAFHQFAQEAGMVAYFRPLSDAKPLGKLRFEIGLLKWNTKIDDSKDAWNNTFVHPDSTHWLKEGPRLGIPGLAGRIGITDKMDLGLYWTISPGANYGIWGAQVQYNWLNNKEWAASSRLSSSAIYGPEDLKFRTYGLDLLGSKEFALCSDWLFVSPYAGISAYLSSAKENSSKVDLHTENRIGGQAMLGLNMRIASIKLAVEYNFAPVSTFSFKLAAGLFGSTKTSKGS